MTVWNNGPQKAGEEPRALSAFLLTESRAGHVESCLNMGGPPSKPKYYCTTDSELVP